MLHSNLYLLKMEFVNEHLGNPLTPKVNGVRILIQPVPPELSAMEWADMK
jgi:hypothetical protein